jgi:dTDP-4-amino-4,6-dideoxygalactose transaminase
MIPLAIPNLSGNEKQYLCDCIDSSYVSSVGPFVDRLEQCVALASGALGGVATSSGTTGLHSALVCMGVEAGDLVIVPSLSFIASANAVAHTHALPWFIDIESESLSIDPELINSALQTNTYCDDNGILRHRGTSKRVGAILPVYALGAPADMDRICAIAKAYKLPVIADAAAALGSTYKGKPVANIGADLTVFSFNGNKTVTAGGGGVVVGNNLDNLKKLRHLTTTARVGSDYDHDMVGFNYRMTNLQAAVGCAQMERLDEFVSIKRKVCDFYNAEFKEISHISPLPSPIYSNSACWFSGFLADASLAPGIRTKLRELGIDARPFWKPLHLQVPYSKSPRETLTNSEKIWGRIITLPCSTGITNDELKKVSDSVKEVMRSFE